MSTTEEQRPGEQRPGEQKPEELKSEELKSEELNKPRGRDYFKKYGPICTSEGFYQHKGECWSDAFQMMMLYTDGIKEFTQTKLALENVEFKEIEELFEPIVMTSLRRLNLGENASGELRTKNLRAIFLYFKAVQERFRRHYLAEIERLEKYGPLKCYSFEKMGQESLNVLREMSTLYRSPNKGLEKSGIRAAIMTQQTKEYVLANREKIANTNYGSNTYRTGGTKSEILYLTELYNTYFNLKLALEILDPYGIKEKDYSNCYYLILRPNSMESYHAVCFLQCGSQEYYYDDNEGIFPFPWKKLFTQFQEARKAIVKLSFGGTLVVQDSATKVVLFHTKSYPFIYHHSVSNINHWQTFLDGVDEPIHLVFEDMEHKLKEKKIEINGKLYTFTFKPNTTMYFLEDLYSIKNLRNDYEKATFNAATGKYLGSRIKKQETNLSRAIFSDNKDEIIKLLNVNSSNPNQKDIEGNTVLHVAIHLNDKDFLQALLTNPDINLNAQNRIGFTPLHEAISQERYELAKLLLEAGANPMIKSPNSFYPLELAIAKSNYLSENSSFYAEILSLIELFLQKLDGKFMPIFHKEVEKIIRNENLQLLNLFVKYGVNVNEPYTNQGDYLLFIPIHYETIEMFKYLLQQGADPTLEEKNGMNVIDIIYSELKNKKTRTMFLDILKTQIRDPKIKEKIQETINIYEKVGGRFSRTRKNSRTKKRKTRKQ